MVGVIDVAEHILAQQGSMTAMKLQKLVYYAKAWHAVWDEEELYPEKIEAWANGPVVPSLYARHRGCFKVGPGHFTDQPAPLDDGAAESVASVLEFYGDKNPQYLSELTHGEAPWIDAREGLESHERGNREITLEAMVEYYSAL